MKVIEVEPYFWELYQYETQFFLSIAIDLGSTVSCWEIELTQAEIENYQTNGRKSIVDFTQQCVKDVYRGNTEQLDARRVNAAHKNAMLAAFKSWQANYA